MTITREDVLHVANLAKLSLSEKEVGRMQRDLDQFLEYVQLLAELDTRDVPPTAHVAVQSAPLREDQVRGVLTAEETLREAPRQAGGGFAVPAFVDEG